MSAVHATHNNNSKFIPFYWAVRTLPNLKLDVHTFCTKAQRSAKQDRFVISFAGASWVIEQSRVSRNFSLTLSMAQRESDWRLRDCAIGGGR